MRFAKRALRVLGYLLAGVVVLAVIALALLHSPWGKAFVRDRLQARLAAAVDGSVTIGAVDFSLLLRDMELRDLAVRDRAGELALGIGRLSATLDRRSVIDRAPVIEQLAIAGLDVHTARLKGLAKPRPAGGSSLSAIRVRTLSVDGAVAIARPDGTRLALSELHLAGSVAARPPHQELEVALGELRARARLERPGRAPTEAALAIGSIQLTRAAGAVDLAIDKLAAGALTLDRASGHLALAGGALAGEQRVAIANLRVDDAQLHALLGRELLRDDATIAMTIAGPPNALVVDGDVATNGATLALDGSIDASDLANPRYQLALAGSGLRSDSIVTPRALPPVEATLHATLAGVGRELRADVAVTATTPGAELDAVLSLAPDRTVTSTLKVHGAPARIAETLAKYGIAVPPRVPLPPELDLAVTATGNVDGTVAVTIAPTKIALARGSVSVSGTARLEDKQLADARVDIGLAGLDLAQLARLAGKRPPVGGRLGGTLVLDKRGDARIARYALTATLPQHKLRVTARGTAQATRVVATVDAYSAHARVAHATVDVPLTQRAGRPTLDVQRPLAIHVDAARAIANVGDVTARIAIAGSAARPTGTLDVEVTATKLAGATQRLNVHADLAGDAQRTVLTTRGTAWLRDGDPHALISGSVTTAPLVQRGRLATATLRRTAIADLTVTLPPRELSSLAWLRPQLARIPGILDGQVAIRGSLAAPQLASELHVRELPTADGQRREVTLTATGTREQLAATLAHSGGLTITADVDRRTARRTAITARATADKVPLARLLPSELAPLIGTHTPGVLDVNLAAQVALAERRVDRAVVTGTLDVSDAAFRLPDSPRVWDAITLSLASELTGLRLRELSLRERDRETRAAGRDRTIRGTGFVAWDRFRPQTATLELKLDKWLLSGVPVLGQHDAPRATLDMELAVEADLRAPVIAVDATVRSLTMWNPDRFERAHHPEVASVSGDVIFVDDTAAIGKLPGAPPASVAAPRARRPIDVAVHIAPTGAPIHVTHTPLDLLARGELTLRVRDEGLITRGAVTFEGGSIALLGHAYPVKRGAFTMDDANPKGVLDVAFERPLPPAVQRELSRASAGGGSTFRLRGSPGNPDKIFGGANNASLLDTMAINVTGHPAYVASPERPASETVNGNHGENLTIMSFMASNLPHLLFLDRVTLWADPYRDAAAYGRIRNAELERYSRDQRNRVRAVARPPTPGRSTTELQLDRLFLNSDTTAIGVGLRGGDRAGGGVGLFFEWASQ